MFGFQDLNELTTSKLRQAFVRLSVVYHPDKGGTIDLFDEMLQSYVYLSETLHRLHGGRASLQIVNAPDELRNKRAEEERANQYINALFDDSSLEPDTSIPLPTDFHERFVAEHINVDASGYADWLQKDTTVAFQPHLISDTIKDVPEFSHTTFEQRITDGKPPPNQHIMLHPEAMGYSTASGGYTLMKSANYTSDKGLRPEYVDLHDAFTSENTIFDKVAPPTAAELQQRTYDDLLKERDTVYTCHTDADSEAIAAFERKKIDADTDHKKALDSYFKKGVLLTNASF
jgi:hypothetical protein